MLKTELVETLKKIEVPIKEGTPSDDVMEEEIRVCFWDYYWEPQTASGNEYNTIVTYQISVIADRPRHPKLLELKHILAKLNLFPAIQHEYNPETKRWHSFFSLEVEENV